VRRARVPFLAPGAVSGAVWAEICHPRDLRKHASGTVCAVFLPRFAPYACARARVSAFNLEEAAQRHPDRRPWQRLPSSGPCCGSGVVLRNGTPETMALTMSKVSRHGISRPRHGSTQAASPGRGDDRRALERPAAGAPWRGSFTEGVLRPSALPTPQGSPSRPIPPPFPPGELATGTSGAQDHVRHPEFTVTGREGSRHEVARPGGARGL
jgi:hypothetical protein